MNLGEYLKAAASTPWTPGIHDCSAWPARWAGIQIPSYSTDEEAERLVADGGGLVALWSKWIGDSLRRISEPQAGDVGIIRVITLKGRAEAGAIFTGQRWAFLTPAGLALVPTAPIAVWRVPCPKH